MGSANFWIKSQFGGRIANSLSSQNAPLPSQILRARD